MSIWNDIITRILSFTKNGIIATTYLDNEIIKGNIFTIGLLQSFTAGQTIYATSEIPIGSGLNSVFLLPIRMNPSSGYLTLKIYEDTEYTGGTRIYSSNRNRESSITSVGIVKLGATGTNKGTELNFPILSGSAAKGTTPGGGPGGSANSIILNKDKKYLFEIYASADCLAEITAEFAEI